MPCMRMQNASWTMNHAVHALAECSVPDSHHPQGGKAASKKQCGNTRAGTTTQY
jgi:hypothetical protein